MVVRLWTRWIVTAVFGVLAALALRDLGLDTDGVVPAALCLIPIVVAQRMRLTADDRGVTVVNLVRAVCIPWSEISDFRLGGVWLTTCLDICRRDGSLVHAWVVTPSGSGGLPAEKFGAILDDLRRRLLL